MGPELSHRGSLLPGNGKTYCQSSWACFVNAQICCKTHFVPASCTLSSSISQDVLWKQGWYISWYQSSPVFLKLLTLKDLICFQACFVNAQVCCKTHFVCTVAFSWAGMIQHNVLFIVAWKREKTYYQSLWACFVSPHVFCKTHFVPVSCNLSSSMSQDVPWKSRSIRLGGPEQYCCVWLPGMAHDAHLPDQVEILNRPQPPLRPPSLIALAWSSLQCHPLSVVHYCLEMKKNILLKFVSLFCECAGLLQNTFRTCVLHTF